MVFSIVCKIKRHVRCKTASSAKAQEEQNQIGHLVPPFKSNGHCISISIPRTSLNCCEDNRSQAFKNPCREIEDICEELTHRTLPDDNFIIHLLCAVPICHDDVEDCVDYYDCDGDNSQYNSPLKIAPRLMPQTIPLKL